MGSDTNRQKRIILVVDDDSRVLFMLLHALMTLGVGHHILTATNGAEALAKAQATRVHLLITDLDMPGPSGFKVTEGVRAMHPDVALIWITARAKAGLYPDAERLRVCRCLEKPVGIRQICQAARRALQESERPPAALARAQ